jgi:hypothetical protein
MITHKEAVKGLPSASSFDANFLCPGKWMLEKRFIEEQESADARRGNRIHEALEKSDLSILSDAEQITASICMDNEAQLIDKYDFEYTDEVVWEQRLWDVDDEFNPLWSAQLDYLRFTQGRALLIDHKTGWGIPVAIGHNWQIKAQAALAWFYYELDEVVAALSHPHHPTSRMEAEVYTAKQCAEFMVTIRGHVEQMQLADKRRIPNGVSCEYCKARNMCPERLESLDKTARAARDEIRERGFTALIDRNPDERAVHFKQMKDLNEHSALVMQRYATMEADVPGSVAGYKLQKAWQRSIPADKESEAIELIKQEYGDRFAYSCMTFSLTECVESIRRQQSIGLVNANAKIEALLKGVIKWKAKRPWLVEARYYGETHQPQAGDGT